MSSSAVTFLSLILRGSRHGTHSRESLRQPSKHHKIDVECDAFKTANAERPKPYSFLTRPNSRSIEPGPCKATGTASTRAESGLRREPLTTCSWAGTPQRDSATWRGPLENRPRRNVQKPCSQRGLVVSKSCVCPGGRRRRSRLRWRGATLAGSSLRSSCLPGVCYEERREGRIVDETTQESGDRGNGNGAAAISNAITGMHREHFGRGASRTRTV